METQRTRIRPRCTWTGRHSDEVKEVRLEVLDYFGIRTRDETFTVLPEHEEDLRRFVAYHRRFGRLTILLIVLSFVAMVVLDTPLGVGLSMLGIGVLMLVFPFATPGTVQMIGTRASIRTVRFLGMVTILIGLLMAFRGD